MTDHWETQPRVPAGNPDGGQWTAAGRAAREAAGLPSMPPPTEKPYGEVKGVGFVPDRMHPDGGDEVLEIVRFTGINRLEEGLFSVTYKERTEILYTEGSNVTHNRMIQAVHKDRDVDDYVRFYYYRHGLEVFLTGAGVVEGWDSDWEVRALDNVYKAVDRLVARGFPEGFPVRVFRSHLDEVDPWMEFDT